MKRLYPFIVMAAALLFAGGGLRAADTGAAADIDSYARKIRSDWNVPGFGLTVYKGDSLILSKGYGVREKGLATPLDPTTLLHIGSVSKSFTAALMAMLVDEGVVSWDDRVKDHLPWFHMADSAVAENLLVRDIMSHRIGLNSQAGTYFPNLGYDRDDVLEMLCRVTPRYEFRDGIHYNNMAFIIAEKIIEAHTGKSWEENLQERIFAPLGMTSGTSGEEGFLAAQNRAAQHYFHRGKESGVTGVLKGEGRALHWLTVIGPAGGICTNTEDLAKWALFHLRKGQWEGRQIISEEQIDFLHRGQGVSTQNEEKITLYGHCWYIEQNDDYRVYYHTGTTWGHTALCVFVPELDLAFAMLFNAETPGGCRFSLMRRIIDIFRGAPYTDYSTTEKRNWLKGGGGSSNKSGWTIALRNTAVAPSALVGKYTKDEVFGDASVSLKEGKPYLKMGKKGWSHRLVHVKGNRYTVSSGGHTYPVIFEIGKNGRATAFEINWGCGESLGPWKRAN